MKVPALATLLAVSFSLHAAKQPELVQPTSVRKLVSEEGKHNAFTDLAHWRGAYWLMHRAGLAHNSKDADTIVLRSIDTEKWTEARRIDMAPDDRAGHMLVTPNRLFVFSNAIKGTNLQAYVTYTDDGEKWSEIVPCLEPQWIFWKPIEHKGRFYANAHFKAETKNGGPARESRLITSADGLHWEIISTVRKGNWESETSFYFDDHDKLYAFLRTKYTVAGDIYESLPPYTEWTGKKTGVHFSGHSTKTFRGVTYLFSRRYGAQSKTTTMIYTLADGKLTPYCELLSGGDCSYAGAVELVDEMLVSYYSSHEGPTSIYLARVPLKKNSKP